jgi:hypothetical protein
MRKFAAWRRAKGSGTLKSATGHANGIRHAFEEAQTAMKDWAQMRTHAIWAGRVQLDKPMSQTPPKGLLAQLGPGLITGASDDDPSGISTYSQAGAAIGQLAAAK